MRETPQDTRRWYARCAVHWIMRARGGRGGGGCSMRGRLLECQKSSQDSVVRCPGVRTKTSSHL